MENSSGSSPPPPLPPLAAEIPNLRGPGVIFIIDRLPYNSDLSRTARRVSEAELRETYHRCLQTILQSPIWMAEMVGAAYFKYGDNWYEMKSYTDDWGTPSAFNRLLLNLSNAGEILNQDEEVTWSRIHGLPALVESLPKIGLLAGPHAQDVEDVGSYIANAPRDQTFAFVVGDFGDSLVHGHINAYVNVSNYRLSPEASLTRVCTSLEGKWGIH